MEPRYVRIVLPEARYTLFETGTAELPELVFVNASLRGFRHREIFPWHLRATIEAAALADRGMPAPEEYDVLHQVAESIGRAVEGDNALPLARSTWNGVRELVFRVHDPEIANEALQRLLEGENLRPWEFRMDHDPEWALAESEFRLFEIAKPKAAESSAENP